MNTKNLTQEQISAFSDGEADSQSETVLAALRQAEGRTDWDLYHQIGDVLRSEEMGFSMSADFQARMTARLELEPTIIAPAVIPTASLDAVSNSIPAKGKAVSSKKPLNRLALAGIAAAVAAALIGGPQMMVAFKGSATDPAPTMVVAASPNEASARLVNSVQKPAASLTVASSEVVAVGGQDGIVLRDPRIDEYLLAHQRFSPSVFSTAQYARSAAFATEANK
jgi:sigma-E factor negative regulatory protein RseA